MNKDYEVRLALNPSILDRIFGNGYYFYDDVPVSYKALLDEERLLLPSQRQNEEDFFGHLFLRFCARLAKHQAEMNDTTRTVDVCLSIVMAFCLVLFSWIVVTIDAMDHGLVLLLFVGITGLILTWLLMDLPAESLSRFLAYNIQGVESDYHEIQVLVDEMAPLFRDHGYHVDYVESKKKEWYPLIVYVRFSRDKHSTEEDGSLAERMMSLQQKARADYTDALIAKRQASKKGKGSDEFLCGIQTKTAQLFRPCILFLIFVLGFIYSIMFLAGMGSDALYELVQTMNHRMGTTMHIPGATVAIHPGQPLHSKLIPVRSVSSASSTEADAAKYTHLKSQSAENDDMSLTIERPSYNMIDRE